MRESRRWSERGEARAEEAGDGEADGGAPGRRAAPRAAGELVAPWSKLRAELRRNWRQEKKQAEPQVKIKDAPFVEYPKQQLAFDAADAASSGAASSSSGARAAEPRIFSREISTAGKRVFCGTSLRTFWEWYAASKMEQTSFKSSRGHPCRLHGHRILPQFNPELMERRSSSWRSFQQVADELQITLGILIRRDAFLDLDSSTPKSLVDTHRPSSRGSTVPVQH